MAHTILSLAKTTRPTLALVAPRERLYRELDATLAESRAVWITGPPGAGKTTLVASYLDGVSRPTLWYQLDATDGDIATFLHYLRQTAIKHSPASSNPIPELDAGDAGDWPACARRLFRAIYARFGRGLALVFDNHEEVPQHAALQGILALAVDETPPGRNLFFLSRSGPPASLSRALLNHTVRQLPAESLRLTSVEFGAIALLRNAGLPAPALQRIEHASTGWMAGAIMLIEHSRLATTEVSACEDEGTLYNYLAQEIFERFDDHVQRLLLEVCWVRRLSLPLAEAITGDDRIRQLLVGLALNNYFVTERDDHGQREFILHPLLRDFLQARARSGARHQSIATRQLRSAEFLLEAGNVEEAVELLVANHEWDRLEAVILRHAQLLIGQARHELLRTWIEELPLERVATRGWLTYWQGIANLGDARRSGRRALEKAMQLFLADSDAPGVAHAACSLIELVFESLDDFSMLDGVLHALRPLLEAPPAALDDATAQRALVMFVAASALRDPAGIDLAQWLERAEAATRGAMGPELRPGLRLQMALARLLCGGRPWQGRELAGLFGGEDVSPVLAAHARLLTSLSGLLLGEPATTFADCRSMLESMPGDLPARQLRLARIAVVAAGLLADRTAEISTELAAVRRDLDIEDKLGQCLGHYVVSWAALCAGDVIDACASQQHAVAVAVELGIPFLEVLCRTALAQLLFQCRDARAGSAQLRRVHALARDMRNPFLEHLTLLVYGSVALLEKRTQSGVNALRYAFGLSRQHGLFNLPWWSRPQLAALCVQALEHEIEVDLVRHLVQRCRLRPRQMPVHLAQWPWAFKVTSFGAFTVDAANGAGLMEALGHGRPAQLLKLLVGAAAGGIRAEAVSEIMWPRIESEYAMKSLTINLHRLRKLLEIEDVVLLRDGHLSLNPELVWVDTRAFEHLCAAILGGRVAEPSLAPGAVPTNAAEALFTLYQGPWLAGDPGEAYTATRAYLRSRFVDAVTALCAVQLRPDRRRVRAVLERALLCEPAAELLYLQLIQLALEEGDHRLAFESHARCREALRAEGRVPGPGIEALLAAAGDGSER